LKEKDYKEPADIKYQGGEKLKGGPANNKILEPDYKKLLNKKDPLDKQILNLAKPGELKVGVVWIKEENEHSS